MSERWIGLRFRRDERGRELFTAPWGRSYVVEDAGRRAALQRIARRSPVLIALAVAGVATPFAVLGRPWYWAFLALPLVAALDLVPIYRATRGLERVRPSGSSAPATAMQRERAHSMSLARLWLTLACALAGLFLAAPALARRGETSLAWATGAFSAAVAISFAWLLWLRFRED